VQPLGLIFVSPNQSVSVSKSKQYPRLPRWKCTTTSMT